MRQKYNLGCVLFLKLFSALLLHSSSKCPSATVHFQRLCWSLLGPSLLADLGAFLPDDQSRSWRSENWENFVVPPAFQTTLNSCLTQGRVEPQIEGLVNSKDASRPRLTHHHRDEWNETKWMRWMWRNGGMKFVAEENGRNPEKNLPRLRFVRHETSWRNRYTNSGAPEQRWEASD